jgi:hypothetical protein
MVANNRDIVLITIQERKKKKKTSLLDIIEKQKIIITETF